MKPNRLHLPSGLLAVLVLVSAATPSPAQEKGRISPGAEGNLSLRLEIQRAIDRGVAYLIKVQAADKGNWGDPQNPALTALPVMAIVSDPARPTSPRRVPPPPTRRRG